METINIATIISHALHGPSVDGLPLYARTKEDSKIDTESGISKTPKWLSASTTTFNSPNNIRKIFITSRRIVVQYYKPYIKNGKPSELGCWREAAYEDGIDIFEKGMEMVGYNAALDAYNDSTWNMTKAERDKVKKPVRIELRGKALSVIFKPWVCSNLEELYFDPCILFSTDYAPGQIGTLRELYMSGKPCRLGHNESIAVLESDIGSRLNTLTERYPRLKIISMVSNLDEIMKSPQMNKGKSGVSLQSENWANLNKDLIGAKAPFYGLSSVRSAEVINSKFFLRAEIYRYDKEILASFIEAYKEKALSLLAEMKQGSPTKPSNDTTPNGPVVTEKSELEKIFDEASTHGDEVARKLIMLTFNGVSKAEITEELNKMTPEGRAKYNPFK